MAEKLPSSLAKLKVALVHDYLREFGGAERVLVELHNIFPQAPVYVAFLDKQALGLHAKWFANWQIKESWLRFIPFHRRLFSPLRWLAPWLFASFNLSDYDLVISSSNMYFAKGVRVGASAIHVSYCHTPARSLYGYSTMTNWRKNVLVRWGGELINHYLRVVDWQVAQKVDYFIANSQEVRRRIAKFYRRTAVVINPPVNVPVSLPSGQAVTSKAKAADYYLYVNRLAFAKHPEIAVQACTQLNVPLKVVGAGQMLPELQQLAGKSVQFLGAVDDKELAVLYAGAKALLYPVEDEDFGMVPIEAMGHGVPVIAHKSGGPIETIIDGTTGVFFTELSVAGLKAAMARAAAIKWQRHAIWRHARQYSQAHFQDAIITFLQKVIKNNLQKY